MHMLSILIYDYCIISLSAETVLHVGQVPMLVKNNVRRVPASSALTKFHSEAITRVLQILTYLVKEKGMEHKREQR